MRLLAAILLFFVFLGCKADAVVDYETAVKNCKMDTMYAVGPKNDTMVTVMWSYEGLIGAQLPDFTATTIGGKEIDSAYFQDKISIINFWFIGCQPCEDEMPVFNQLVEKYKDSKVNFLALSRNHIVDIEEFAKDKPFNVDQIADGSMIIEDIFHGRWGYPITIVADQNQKILLITRGLGNAGQVSESQKELVQIVDNALAAN